MPTTEHASPAAPLAPQTPRAVVAASRPLQPLSHRARDEVLAQAQHIDAADGSLLVAAGDLSQAVWCVAQGAVLLSDADLGLSVRLNPGDWLGWSVSPQRALQSWQAQAVGSCQLWRWSPQDVQSWCRKHPVLQYFFAIAASEAGAAAGAAGASGGQLLGMPLRRLAQRSPITLPPHASIQKAAALMAQERVSSVLLVDAQGGLQGILTDRDLRTRVIAHGLDITRPVSDVATLNPATVQASRPAFEALLLMARLGVHHVPVLDEDRLLGMVTSTDLTEQSSRSPVYFVRQIAHQKDLDGLRAHTDRVPALQRQLADSGASAYSTGHMISAVTDAVTVRLIECAHARLGPAPVPYVWVAAGSQARCEQSAKSDQDNCLILDDRFDAARHGAYFEALARQVCDGLAACGYVHCPGEMMAMNPTWCQPKRVWLDYFEKWIDQPKPKALMLTCVFFDLRAVHGDASLLEAVRAAVAARTRGNSLFLAHMVGNALKHRPPLGLFGQISVSHRGEHAGTIDLKHAGTVPIIDLARIYALSAGLSVANTQERLESCAAAGEVSEQSARDLRDAFDVLSRLRIAHQVRQSVRGVQPDNHLALDELANLERSQLKEAFGVIQTLQGVLAQRYR